MQTKLDRLIEAFCNGAELTVKQIAYRFDTRDPNGMLYRARNSGFDIVRERRTNSKGESKSFYRLNKPKVGRRKAA
jgi:hypothetical protein